MIQIHMWERLLLSEVNLTFQKAFEIAQGLESAVQNLKTLQGELFDTKCSAIHMSYLIFVSLGQCRMPCVLG